MGRRGRQGVSSDELARRGSTLAKARREIENLKLEAVSGPCFLDFLAAAVQDRGRHHQTVREISLSSGVGFSTLNKFLNGGSNLSGDSVCRLVSALGLRLCWTTNTVVECESEGPDEPPEVP